MKEVSGEYIHHHGNLVLSLTQRSISTRLIIFYVLTSSVTISCNIIDNPTIASAVNDYEILKDVPRLMCHMSTQTIENEERLHRDQLRSFLKELVGAAEHAISNLREKTPSLRNDYHNDPDILDGLRSQKSPRLLSSNQ